MLAWENTVLQFRIQLGYIWIAFCRPYLNYWRLFTACLVNLWMYNMYHITDSVLDSPHSWMMGMLSMI